MNLVGMPGDLGTPDMPHALAPPAPRSLRPGALLLFRDLSVFEVRVSFVSLLSTTSVLVAIGGV